MSKRKVLVMASCFKDVQTQGLSDDVKLPDVQTQGLSDDVELPDVQTQGLSDGVSQISIRRSY